MHVGCDFRYAADPIFGLDLNSDYWRVLMRDT